MFVQRIWQRHKTLVMLLTGSWLLRVVLVVRGGQFFWADERLYDDTLDVTFHLSHLNFVALAHLIVKGDHTGFTAFGFLPAIAQRVMKYSLGLPLYETLWVPGFVLSLASVASIGLTYLLARKMAAGRNEGLVAAFLMSCANTMFYGARHLTPYDGALALALLALWIGIERQTTLRRSFACGLVAGFAFLVYHAYWTLLLVVCVVHVLRGGRSLIAMGKRAASAGVGALLLPALLTMLTAALGWRSYVANLVEFSRTPRSLRQGDFSEGWSLPWEYLWHAEHGLLLVWALGAVVVVALSWRQPWTERARGWLWLGIATAVYLILFVGADVLEQFPVYGRSVRPMVPFLCLTSACAASWLARQRWLQPMSGAACVVAIMVQGGQNFWTPLTQQWPADIARDTVTRYSDLAFAFTMDRPYTNRTLVVPAPLEHAARYVLVNPINYWFPVVEARPVPAGRVLFRTRHPMEFLPYHYEGWKPEERSMMRSTDISMRLLDTQAR